MTARDMQIFFRQNYRSLIRLAAVLCLFQLCFGQFFPFSVTARKKAPDGENGVGGGSRLELVLPENSLAEGLENIESSLIEGVSEPEHFSKPRTLVYNAHTVKKGDLIGNLSIAFGLEDDTLLSVNKVRDSRNIQIGQVLRIPNQDGIMHTVSRSETLATIAAKYKADSESIKLANELFSETVNSGTSLFIPGARLDWVTRQEINGDLFIWPVPSRRITSAYGYRSSPFTGHRQFHSGVDISSSAGTPIRAAMAGRVSAAGWDNTLGNHVVISHHSGYRTLYGHMSVIRVKSGAYVATGERIGDIGSTGQSTAPHLHFTVYKNGVTVNPQALMK